MSINFFLVKFLKKFQNLSTITINSKILCKFSIQTKLRDVVNRLLLYFPNFHEDILQNKKVILHELLQKLGHVILLIHGFKGM